MMRVSIPYEQSFKSNERGYLISDPDSKGKAAWTLDSHCGDGNVYVVLRCPDCCDLFCLTAHSISNDGEVNASILCICNTWHIWGTLEKYKEIVGKPKAAGKLFLPKG